MNMKFYLPSSCSCIMLPIVQRFTTIPLPCSAMPSLAFLMHSRVSTQFISFPQSLRVFPFPHQLKQWKRRRLAHKWFPLAFPNAEGIFQCQAVVVSARPRCIRTQSIDSTWECDELKKNKAISPSPSKLISIFPFLYLFSNQISSFPNFLVFTKFTYC